MFMIVTLYRWVYNPKGAKPIIFLHTQSPLHKTSLLFPNQSQFVKLLFESLENNEQHPLVQITTLILLHVDLNNMKA